MTGGCVIQASRFLLNGSSNPATCQANQGDLITVEMVATFGQRPLNLANPKYQNGAAYWYEFKFPAKGIDHTLLALFFADAPTYNQVFKFNGVNWIPVGATEYLDTVDLNATYGMWITTAIGWSKSYNAISRARADWNIRTPTNLQEYLTGFGTYRPGETGTFQYYLGVATIGTYSIEASIIEYDNGEQCF